MDLSQMQQVCAKRLDVFRHTPVTELEMEPELLDHELHSCCIVYWLLVVMICFSCSILAVLNRSQ